MKYEKETRNNIHLKAYSEHRWSNGRISPCQGGGPGPSPGRCNFF